MKIGLISINAHTKSLNFACPVHTWAFQQFLKKNGIESTIIDYYPNYYDDFPARDPAPYYKKKYENLLKKEYISDEDRERAQAKMYKYEEKLDGYMALRKERMIRYDKFQQFIDDNYVKTDISYNPETLNSSDPGCDCYICVSDVIWSVDPYWGFEPSFLLDCGVMDNKWKIAYAASRGVPKPHTEEEKEYFFRVLSDFNYIGVREESLKEYINENLPSASATVVLDPVLLLKAEEYERIIVKPQETNFVVVYYAMERPKALLKVAAEYAQRHNCKIVELTHIPIAGGLMDDFEVEVLYNFNVGPGEWLGYIKYAECIFTNSFHATCFSILFHKNFFTGKRNGDKLSHVLDMFDLGWRRIAETKNTDLVIDYEPVEQKLCEERERSEDFILSAIRSLENQPLPDRGRDADKKRLQYPVAYNSGKADCVYVGSKVGEGDSLRKLSSKNLEYRSLKELAVNDGNSCLKTVMFGREGYQFSGWHLRVRVNTEWFWVRKDGTLVPKSTYSPAQHEGEVLFENCADIPYMPIREIAVMVADAIWEKKPSTKQRLKKFLGME